MSRKCWLRFVIAGILLHKAVATLNINDDFTNNLFSDLSPLLALFGEQVATQFMSESMGWADYIIFAMAPLGILTAIVGAIRVGGPSWLKAIIGRARENLALAEVGLMSSTSHEVCELWNGQQIVKTMGSPPVKQILWFVPESVPEGKRGGFYTTEDARQDGLLQETVRSEQRSSKNETGQQTYSRGLGSEEDQIQEHETWAKAESEQRDSAPNISLNLHNRVGRTEPRIVAAIAIALQSGTLIYGGFATYYFKYLERGNPVPRYAFPVLAIGTTVLSVGLSLCARVIDSMTTEKEFRVQRSGLEVRVLWLQRAQRVADQSFESFVIFAKDARKMIRTSRRIEGWDDNSGKHEAQLKVQVLALVSTIVTFSGFLLQFIGLRGVHFSVSLVSENTEPQSLRLLGSNNRILRRDLKWWMDGESPRAFLGKAFVPEIPEDEEDIVSGGMQTVIWQDLNIIGGGAQGEDEEGVEDSSEIKLASHRIVGNSKVFSADQVSGIISTFTVTTDSATIEVSPDNDSNEQLLAALSNAPLASLFAQIIFTNFMEAVANKLEEPIDGGARVRYTDTDTVTPSNGLSWQSFTLNNPKLSKIAQGVHQAGLGSLEEVFLSIIPPLSAQGKLPDAIAVIRLARIQAETHELRNHWRKSAEIYLWLSRTCKSFGSSNHIAEKATAVLVEFLRSVIIAAKVSAHQSPTGTVSEELSEVKSKLLEEVKNCDMKMRSKLMKLCAVQKRIKDIGKLELSDWESLAVDTEVDGYQLIDKLGFTQSHYNYSEAIGDIEALLEDDANVNGRDVFDWSLLHYIANRPSSLDDEDPKALANNLQALLEAGADVNARDLAGWTPLHYCSWSGNMVAFRQLLQDGADVNAQGRDGKTPLHCAAMSGNSEVAKRLIEGGANIKVLDASRNMPLHWAAYYGHEKVTEDLLKFGDRRLVNNDGRVPVHLAALSGGSKLFKLFLGKGVDPNVKDRAGYTALHLAAMSGNEDGVQYLLNQKGVNREERENNGRLPLHLAVMKDKSAIVDLFLENGDDTEAKDDDGLSLLLLAAKKGSEATTRLLLDRGFNIDDQDESGYTALCHAADSGHGAMVRLLLDKGAEKEVADLFGRRALHLAAAKGDEAVVNILLDAGAKKEATTRGMQTALHIATENGKLAMVKLLLNRGIDGNSVDDKGGTALHAAARGGHQEISQLLLDCGLEKDAKDKEGITALHHAILGPASQTIRKKVVLLLLDRGVAKDAVDNTGRTALHAAAQEGHAEMVQLLFDSGVDKDAVDNTGRTALHVAAREDHVKVVQLLLDNGFEKNVKDKGGNTVLHHAIWGRQSSASRTTRRRVFAQPSDREMVVTLLLNEGVDKNAVDSAGRTALHVAAWEDHVKIVQLLLDNGFEKDAKDTEGNTALHYAAQDKRKRGFHRMLRFTSFNDEVFRFLLSRGADKNATNNAGKTALDLSRENGGRLIAERLEALVADH